MCRRLMYGVSVVMVICAVLASVARADLLAHWKFDEGAGAQGLVYVDSIRLYGQAPVAMLPQDPGTANL